MLRKLQQLLSASNSRIFISYTVMFILVSTITSIGTQEYSNKLAREILVSEEIGYLDVISTMLVVPILSNSSNLAQTTIDVFTKIEDTKSIYVITKDFSVKNGDTSSIEKAFDITTSITDLHIIEGNPGEWIFGTPLYDDLDDNNSEIIGTLFVHIMSPEVEIMSSKIKSFVIAATGTGGVILWALLYIVINRITKPLKELVGSMKDYNEASQTIAVPDQCPSDIKMVYTSYNNMIRQIRENEASILSHSNDLERIVDERTLKLKQTRDVAIQANKAKDTFVANVSHEIRTPIQAIISSTDILTTKHDDDELNVISSSAEHLISVINNILDLSKIHSNAIVIEKTQFDACDVIKNIRNSVIIQTTNPNVKSTYNGSFNPTPEPLFINTDLTIFRQILLNLLSNAIKFTKTGSIDLSCNPITISNIDYQQFHVKDTGLGISEAMLEKIFMPFVQSDMTRKRTYMGVGLGLTISKKLAEDIGGYITVESKLGVGSTFTLTIPMGVISNTLDTKDNDSVQIQPMNILIAEDHEFIRNTLITILLKEGHTVTGVEDGIGLLDSIQDDNNFDLLFVDVHMPNMDGIEAIQQANGMNLLDDKKVIFLTADATKPIIDQAEELRAMLITKPVSRTQLIKIIATIQQSQDSAV